MGYHLVDRVYNEVPKFVKLSDDSDNGGTDVSEQALLAALAHKCNDQTYECYPSGLLLASMTHLADEPTVSRILGRLKKKGYVKVWKTKSPVKIKANGKEIVPKHAHNNYRLCFPKEEVKPKVKTEVSCLGNNNELSWEQPNISNISSQAEINEAWELAYTSLSLHRLSKEQIEGTKRAFQALLGPKAEQEPKSALHFVDVFIKWMDTLSKEDRNNPKFLSDELIRQTRNIT